MLRGLAFIALMATATIAQSSQRTANVHLTIDASEARQVLNILRRMERGAAVRDADWNALFATQPYRLLKEREASIGAPFDDEQFKTFVASDEARARRPDWEQTLAHSHFRISAPGRKAQGSRISVGFKI